MLPELFKGCIVAPQLDLCPH